VRRTSEGDSRRDAHRALGRRPPHPFGAVARFALCAGFALVLAWLAGTQGGLAPAPARMLFILVLAASLWVFEVVPAYSVGVLIIALQILLLGNPRAGIFARSPGDWETFVVVLGNPLIWLFFGGFVLSSAAARTGLDLSLARRLFARFGDAPGRLLFGLMAGSFCLSLFMSNTATTAMMLAVIAPVVAALTPGNLFRKSLLLGVPFAANLGGMGTLIGSPPNAIAAGALAALPGQAVGFLSWMTYGLPPAMVLFVLAWGYLRYRYPMQPGGAGLPALPPLEQTVSTVAPRWQRTVTVVTLMLTTGLWMTSEWTEIPTAAISFVPITVFTVTGILRDHDVRQLPWDVLLLLAGGLALGNGVRDTGLADWLVASLPMHAFGELAVVLVLCYLVLFLSNLMSNTAAANVLVPIGAAAASGFETLAVVPLALCASCAMCLPISTPPNAMAFSSGELESNDFLVGGLMIGLLAPPLVAGWMLLIGAV
jgi:sodium-dependent dicarboxylate transporter 2/3/5